MSLMYNYAMRRTTIMAPPDVLEGLQELARWRRVPLATIIREALEAKLRERPPKPTIFGIAASGHTDTSELAGEQRAEPREWRS